MTDLQYTILESSNSGLISVSEASQMISMMYESDSVMAKIKNAWESLKKWVKSVVKKLIEKVTGIKIKEKKKVRLPFNLNTVKKNLEKILDHLKPDADFNDSFWNKFKTKTGFFTESYPVRPLEKQKADETYCDMMNDEAYGAMALINSLLLKISDRLNQFELDHVDSQKISTIRNIVSTVNNIIMSAARFFNTNSFKYNDEYNEDWKEKEEVLRKYAELKQDVDDYENEFMSHGFSSGHYDGEKFNAAYKKYEEASKKLEKYCRDVFDGDTTNGPYYAKIKFIETSGSYLIKTSMSIMRGCIVSMNKIVHSKDHTPHDGHQVEDNDTPVDLIAVYYSLFDDALAQIDSVKNMYTSTVGRVDDEHTLDTWYKDVGKTIDDLKKRRSTILQLAKSRGLI